MSVKEGESSVRGPWVEDFETMLSRSLNAGAESPRPLLALAPMQDVTDWAFWKMMSQFGGADFYVTEYFRVQPDYRPEKKILKSVAENPTGKPAAAQVIGNDIPALVRTAKELQKQPIVAVDLNLGCPAPVVYRKYAGGGLLRDLNWVDRILGGLRDAISIRFTVKTRIGFEDSSAFDELLNLFEKHQVDLVTVHGRTVKEMYRSSVNYALIAKAAQSLTCPVLANGNVYSAQRALEVVRETGVAGVMIGRGAIRNPWIFQQIRDLSEGREVKYPKGHEVLEYLDTLYHTVTTSDHSEKARIQKLKKYLNFIGIGIEASGRFLHEVRRVTQYEEFMRWCREYLDHDRPMTLEPFELSGLHAQDHMSGIHR